MGMSLLLGFDPIVPDARLNQSQYTAGGTLVGLCLEGAVREGLREADFLRGWKSYTFDGAPRSDWKRRC